MTRVSLGGMLGMGLGVCGVLRMCRMSLGVSAMSRRACRMGMSCRGVGLGSLVDSRRSRSHSMGSVRLACLVLSLGRMCRLNMAGTRFRRLLMNDGFMVGV